MAISGGAKPSVQMHIKDGVLVVGKVAMRQGVVNDADVAVHRLINGQTVFVQQFGRLVEQVQAAVNHNLLHHK